MSSRLYSILLAEHQLLLQSMLNIKTLPVVRVSTIPRRTHDKYKSLNPNKVMKEFPWNSILLKEQPIITSNYQQNHPTTEQQSRERSSQGDEEEDHQSQASQETQISETASATQTKKKYGNYRGRGNQMHYRGRGSYQMYGGRRNYMRNRRDVRGGSKGHWYSTSGTKRRRQSSLPMDNSWNSPDANRRLFSKQPKPFISGRVAAFECK